MKDGEPAASVSQLLSPGAFPCELVLQFPQGLTEETSLEALQEDGAALTHLRVMCTRWVGFGFPPQLAGRCWAVLPAGTGHSAPAGAEPGSGRAPGIRSDLPKSP